MPAWAKLLYWVIAGALMGFGFLLVFSIGIPLLLVGAVMILYGIKKIGANGFWAALIAMGVAPASLMMYQFLTADRCPPVGGTASCVFFPNGYLYVVALFGAIALAGIVWELLRLFRGRTTR